MPLSCSLCSSRDRSTRCSSHVDGCILRPEPGTAIYLRNDDAFLGAWRPLHPTRVADEKGRIAVTFKSPGFRRLCRKRDHEAAVGMWQIHRQIVRLALDAADDGHSDWCTIGPKQAIRVSESGEEVTPRTGDHYGVRWVPSGSEPSLKLNR